METKENMIHSHGKSVAALLSKFHKVRQKCFYFLNRKFFKSSQFVKTFKNFLKFTRNEKKVRFVILFVVILVSVLVSLLDSKVFSWPEF